VQVEAKRGRKQNLDARSQSIEHFTRQRNETERNREEAAAPAAAETESE